MPAIAVSRREPAARRVNVLTLVSAFPVYPEAPNIRDIVGKCPTSLLSVT
jgi:hypothetical protein